MLGRIRSSELVFAALLLVPVAAHADFYDQPFALRLFFTVDRQNNYASTLARQASLAVLDGGSANPGAAAWQEPLKPSTTLTTSVVYAPSAGGRDIYAAPVTLRWQAPDKGTIALAYAYTDTRDASGDDGLTQALRSDEWIAGYGRRIGDHAAAGFTVRLTSGRIVSDAYSSALGGLPVRASTRFLTPDVNVGYAAEASSAVTLGLVAGYGRARTDTTVTNLTPLVVPLPVTGMPVTVPANSVLDQRDDVISTYSLRAGVGVRVTDATAIYFDAVGLRFSTQHGSSQNLGRFALGSEHVSGNGWILRGGIGVDTIGKVNVSAGFGYRPTRTFEAQLALQSNAAPEVNPEIGRTRLVGGSLAWIF